jgi:hypothetical protein
MELRMEMRMKGMTVHTKRFVSSVISQVPQIVQGVLQGMGGYFNAAPLQLQAPSSSQPALMLTGRVQTPQGSGTSSRPEPTVGMPGSFGHLKDRPDVLLHILLQQRLLVLGQNQSPFTLYPLIHPLQMLLWVLPSLLKVPCNNLSDFVVKIAI